MTKILVIDDKKVIREKLKRLLELSGYETYTAEDGQKGIFDREKSQIVLVDIRQPGMDAIELLKRIKEKSNATEVIIITGHGGLDSAIEAIREDTLSYIQKPLEYDELFIDIKKALEKQKAAQQQVIQQERLRALEQMASGIVHDVNNVLTPILAYSEFLLMAPENLDDKKEVMNCLTLMNMAAKDASNIVSRLREFYRHRNEGEIFSPVNLNQLVEQAIELTRPNWEDQALASNITIKISKDLQEVPLISGDKTELREVLTNLILNAVDAMSTSGTITIRTRYDDGHVVLEISDTGIGMTEEVRQRCFERFFSTKGEHGTGLGLSIVDGIIRRREGTIEIESAPGKGTTFTIRLPT